MKKLVTIILLLAALAAPDVMTAQNIHPPVDGASKIVGADSAISTPFFAVDAGWTFPGGEMGKRYSSFVNFDGILGWKTKNNWLYMLDFCFQFGSNNVKHIEDILSTMVTTDHNSFVIAADGTDAGVVGYNRNLSLQFSFGKIFPLWFSNPNSGLMLNVSAGYIQHQIIFDNTMGTVPQIDDDYKYGYDRQSRGPIIGAFAGYFHMSKKSYANWYGGVSFHTAWTHITRDVQFDQIDLSNPDYIMKDLSGTYTDYMFTVKLGWMIPFFGRSADRIYYF